jgi:hypothetical protein
VHDVEAGAGEITFRRHKPASNWKLRCRSSEDEQSWSHVPRARRLSSGLIKQNAQLRIEMPPTSFAIDQGVPALHPAYHSEPFARQCRFCCHCSQMKELR